MRLLQAARSWAEMLTRRSMRAVRVSFRHRRTLGQSDAETSGAHGSEGRLSIFGLMKSGSSSCMKQGGELYSPNSGRSGAAEPGGISGGLVERPAMMRSLAMVCPRAAR